ncbi:MAG TPA: RluA family pseudouridine synthase [Acidobacteriaceae bacterium]
MTSTFSVPAEAAGQRLDAWLAAQLAGVSRERVQMLLRQEKVRLNGQCPRASYRLRGGEFIEVLGDPVRPPLKAFAEDIPLRVVYEDDALSVIDKPAGMMVHAGAGVDEEGKRGAGTLVNALLHRYRTLSTTGGDLRPGIVHRLDKQTSGLIVVARTDAVHTRLAEMFSRRQMRKTYIALVHGRLKKDKGTIDAPVARDLVRRTRMTTRREDGARSALSHYTVERRISSAWGEFTLVRVRIETGRTHQIRVHLASIGHSVVGDTLYGAPARMKREDGEELRLERNFLHAAELEFAHPVGGQPLHLEAPLPPELLEFLARLETA